MARHLAGVCSKCRAIILHSAHKNICAMIGMDNWKNKHLTPLSLNKCVRGVFLGPAKINNHIETSVTFAHSLSFFSLKRQCLSDCMQLLTGVCDRETVGGLQVVNVVIEVEGFLRRILVGVVQLDSEPEGAVLLHRGAHEQSSYRGGRKKMSHGSALGFVHSPHTCHIFSP